MLKYKTLNILQNLTDRDDKILEIAQWYEASIFILKDIFDHILSTKITLFKKHRDKEMISDNKISKTYNPYIIISLCLLKILIPYWNKFKEQEKQISTLSDKDLIILRGIESHFDRFRKTGKKDSTLKRIPKDFNNIINLENKGPKGDNFKKYVRSFTKDIFLSAIGNLCKSIDDGSLQGDSLEFLKESLKNFISSLGISKTEFSEKKIRNPRSFLCPPIQRPRTFFEEIFNTKLGEHFYYKTRERFHDNFSKQLKEKIIFGK